MPGDGSCLYHARRAWFAPISRRPSPDSPGRRELVEAPGTAPGSATLIPQAVYRHSRLPDAERYRVCRAVVQSRSAHRDLARADPCRAHFETPAVAAAQDEDSSFMRSIIFLMLRSTRRGRLEARSTSCSYAIRRPAEKPQHGLLADWVLHSGIFSTVGHSYIEHH